MPDIAREILRKFKKIAVVGLSPDTSRASHNVTRYMIRQGYDVVGVRPGSKEILGRPCFSSLSETPGPLEIVNVFRAPEFVAEIVEECIRLKAKALWLQEGVYDEEAEKRAKNAGILVVSDTCILKEHQNL